MTKGVHRFLGVIIIAVLGLSLLILLIPSMGKRQKPNPPKEKAPNLMVQYTAKDAMLDLLKDLRQYAINKKPGFKLLANNGLALFPDDDSDDSVENKDEEIGLLIHGAMQESLFYGWDMVNGAVTPAEMRDDLLKNLYKAKAQGIQIFNIDYCATLEDINSSYDLNQEQGIISFTASSRELDVIPTLPEKIIAENNHDVTSFAEVQNFLILLNPQYYSNKEEFLIDISSTNYDLLIIDLYCNEELLTKKDLARLKTKKNGGKRQVIAYMSVGECEDYRCYWQEEWADNPPKWLEAENPNWPGNYKVKYWDKEWQGILFGGDNSYLNQIIQAGFDGVFLDVVDAFWYYEGIDIDLNLEK